MSFKKALGRLYYINKLSHITIYCKKHYFQIIPLTPGGLIRDPGVNNTYICNSGFTKDNPATELATCEINDDQFRTLIEHGDW